MKDQIINALRQTRKILSHAMPELGSGEIVGESLVYVHPDADMYTLRISFCNDGHEVGLLNQIVTAIYNGKHLIAQVKQPVVAPETAVQQIIVSLAPLADINDNILTLQMPPQQPHGIWN